MGWGGSDPSRTDQRMGQLKETFTGRMMGGSMCQECGASPDACPVPLPSLLVFPLAINREIISYERHCSSPFFSLDYEKIVFQWHCHIPGLQLIWSNGVSRELSTTEVTKFGTARKYSPNMTRKNYT